MTDKHALTHVDWEYAENLVAGDKALAKELFVLFLQHLSNDLVLIKQLYTAGAVVQLRAKIHALHSSICYCGLLNFKEKIVKLEKALKEKKSESEIQLLYEIFMGAAKEILDHYT